MKTSFTHYERYYNTIKCEIKSEYVQQAIEKIALSIKTNIKYICHCYFINVTTFGFVWDSIAEAANSGIKSGNIQVSTNMTINRSSAAQLKIGENHNLKKQK